MDGPLASHSRPSFPWAAVALGAICVAALVALGVWQVHRLSWKLALIARVDQRVHAAPVPPPGPARWPAVTAARDEYRHVDVGGHFENDRETLVQAVTDYGAGFWVMTPLRTTDGATILIDRGFVPPNRRDRASRAAGEPSGPVHVVGLLRISEPHGGFLRSNDPAAGRWYSRDVPAIAATRGLTDVAPFFIDADATPNPGGLPIGGLTVIAFPNNHLVYAITWFTLAAMLLATMVWLVRDERRERGRGARETEKPAADRTLSQLR